MKRLLAVASASLILSLGLTACGGGGGSSSNGNNGLQSAGFEVPTEISAVPTNLSGSVGGVTKSGFKSKLFAWKRAATDANTDYSKAKTVKYVNEHTLEQFDIIEQVLSAIAQTNYADSANINQGPYKAMIAWQEERDGIETKTLEPWVVDSAMITENGKDVNRLRAWIEETRDGQTKLIKAEFKIYQSATQRDDGSYSDYGVWTLNVKFGDSTTEFFAASADIDANGHAVVKVHEVGTENGPGGAFTRETKAIMNRAETEGYGKVMFPDWESCHDPNCVPAPVEAKYAYNTTHLAVQKGSDPVQFKDRASITEMTHRYGVFDSVTGEDVLKTKSFGFPISYADSNGNRQWGYYGAWQGRHQLWGSGDSIPAGTVVRRQDRGNEQTAETYTVAAPFGGTFTKRTLVAGAVSDIQGIAVETWINKHYNLVYSGANSQWESCDGWIDFGQNPPLCTSGSFAAFTDFGALLVSQNDRKFVNVGHWDMNTQTQKNYVYLASDPGLSGYTSPGFYEAQPPQPSQPGGFTPVSPAVRLTEANGVDLFVDIGGSIYISYTGEFSGPTTTTGWVQKTLTGFDQNTWTPTFDPNGDVAFTPDPGREYYINSNGANFIVRRKNNSTMDANAFDVMIELQSAANPTNVASMLPSGAVYLRSPWRPEVRYTFVTSAGTNFLMLLYLTDDPNTSVDESATPTVVTNGEWGLQAYDDNGTPNDFTDDRPLQADGTPVTVDQWGNPSDPSVRPVQFNWEYAQAGTGWGAQQFLLDANNNYVVLSDPIMFEPVTLTNNAGQSKTLSLQYDGWMHGLPDLFRDLMDNGFVMTDDISNKIINIPEGTEVVDAHDSTKSYLIKPLEVSQFLNVVADPGNLAISAADAIDLNSVPVFVEHNMGDTPVTTGVKYSEGVLVE